MSDKKIEKDLGTVIPHPYDINIFSHILILINRYRKVGNKKISGLDTLNEEETKFVLMHQKIYHIAKEISKNIENYIGKQLLDADSYYIFEYLLSSRTVSSDTVPINTDRRVINIADDYFDIVSELLGRTNDFTDIRNDLINHIKPMLNRIKYSLNVKNNLLDQIKSEYSEVFTAAQEATKIIEKKERIPEIPDDEVGFLALYFAQSLERDLPRIKVLIMCTTGVGTAELLKVKVARSFSNLDIVSVISEREFRQIRSPDIDLVISTIPINDSKIPLVVVSAIFNSNDKQIVSDEVEKIERKKVSVY
ncbi:PRD domain-containing protein [Oenococcus oeni]